MQYFSVSPARARCSMRMQHVLAGIALLELGFGAGNFLENFSEMVNEHTYMRSLANQIEVDVLHDNNADRPSMKALREVTPFGNIIGERADAEGRVERHVHGEAGLIRTGDLVLRHSHPQTHHVNKSDSPGHHSKIKIRHHSNKDLDVLVNQAAPVEREAAADMQEQTPATTAPAAKTTGAPVVTGSTTAAGVSTTAAPVAGASQEEEEGSSFGAIVSDLLIIFFFACFGGALFRCVHQLLFHNGDDANEELSRGRSGGAGSADGGQPQRRPSRRRSSEHNKDDDDDANARRPSRSRYGNRTLDNSEEDRSGGSRSVSRSRYAKSDAGAKGESSTNPSRSRASSRGR